MTTTQSSPAESSTRHKLRLSIVTPSYNQGPYIEETLNSVISQKYPNLEYIVIDGGSKDNSVEVIRKYQNHLAYWVSEPDNGQYHALNKGLSRCTGDIMAWLNSDDKYCPWAFQVVAEIFTDCPEINWLTTSTQLFWNADGLAAGVSPIKGFAARWLYWGWHLGDNPHCRGWIQQESTFWRRSLWEAAGGRIDDSLDYAGDFELWARFYQHSALTTVNLPLGGFRFQPQQKTNSHMKEYYEEAHRALAPYAARYGKPPAAFGRLLRRVLSRLGRGKRFFADHVQSVTYDHEARKWCSRTSFSF